jgi:hypothetical protein
MPGLSLFHAREFETDALVISEVEPEHTGKYLFSLPEPAEAPQAEAQAMETPEERAVRQICDNRCFGPYGETIE